MSISVSHPGVLARAQSALGAARPGLRLTIRCKILLAFLCMGGITAGLGAYAVFNIAAVGRLTEQTFDGALMSISYARAASADFAGIEAVTARLAHGTTMAADRAGLSAQVDDLSSTLDDDLAVAGQRSLSPQAVQAAADAAAAIADWRAAVGLDAGADAVVGNAHVDALARAVSERLDLLVNYAAGDGFRFRERARAKLMQAKRLALLGTGLAVVLGTVVAVLLTRRIIVPVAAPAPPAGPRAAGPRAPPRPVGGRIAAGQLDTHVPVGGSDELGALLAAMAVMRANIAAMVAREVAQRRSAQACLTDAIEGSSEGVMVVDGVGSVAVANTRMNEYLRILGSDAVEGPAPLADRAPLRALMGAVDKAGETCLPDGRWLRVSRSGTRDGGFVAICSDITGRKQHEAALERANTWLDAALNNMAQGLCMFDAEQKLRLINRRFCEIFQIWPAMPAIGTTFRELYGVCTDAGAFTSAEEERLYEARMARIAQGVPYTQVLEMGQGRVVSVTHQPMPGGGWVTTYENITDRVRAEEKISHMARHDALTGLPNRVVLEQAMEAAVAGLEEEDGAFAVLVIDLDGFKAVNETLGFPAGDQVLRDVAERLSGCLRRSESVARLGADEFVVIASGLRRPQDAAEAARRMGEAVSAPYAVHGREVELGACVGIVMAPADGAAADALLRKADLALRRAKQDGRGTVCFFEAEMDARQQARRTMETDLRAGLAKKEFELLYQPLFDLRENRVCGFEALLRWNHPAGRVSPVKFIPVAEDTGMIVQVGEWALTEACMEAAAWPVDVKVAVNVSPIQFRSPNLVPAVQAALAQSGLPAARLELEITESVLMVDSEATLAILHQLRELGVRISMDDFGTGFSSLGYLRSFPFDKIKIDQSFVRDLTAAGSSGGNAQAIVRAITGLGSNLGMRITAEGVETAAQLDHVRREGCSEVQGYLFSRPAMASDVAGLIRTLGARGGAVTPAA